MARYLRLFQLTPLVEWFWVPTRLTSLLLRLLLLIPLAPMPLFVLLIFILLRLPRFLPLFIRFSQLRSNSPQIALRFVTPPHFPLFTSAPL